MSRVLNLSVHRWRLLVGVAGGVLAGLAATRSHVLPFHVQIWGVGPETPT